MFREYRPHNCGLSLRVNHSAGLNCLPCLIEGSDQSMDLIRVKRPLGVLCEKCAHSLPTGDGKKVAQSLARGNGIRVFHVIASSGALQKSEERSRATTGSPKSRRLGLSVSSPKEDARRKSLSSEQCSNVPVLDATIPERGMFRPPHVALLFWRGLR